MGDLFDDDDLFDLSDEKWRYIASDSWTWILSIGVEVFDCCMKHVDTLPAVVRSTIA